MRIIEVLKGGFKGMGGWVGFEFAQNWWLGGFAKVDNGFG
jgi:hypothetical protein